MKLNIKSGHTEVIGLAFFGILGCKSVVPDPYVKLANYVPWIERNQEEFVDPHFDIIQHPWSARKRRAAGLLPMGRRAV